jgi:DNA-binding MarR family transcriptional regulator
MHMGVTASTMSIGTDRLVRGGYITRERDPQDARRVQLRLTEAGLRIRQQQSVLDPDLVLLLLKRLTAKERAEGLRGMALLADAATEVMKQKSLGGARWKDAT